MACMVKVSTSQTTQNTVTNSQDLKEMDYFSSLFVLSS